MTKSEANNLSGSFITLYWDDRTAGICRQCQTVRVHACDVDRVYTKRKSSFVSGVRAKNKRELNRIDTSTYHDYILLKTT